VSRLVRLPRLLWSSWPSVCCAGGVAVAGRGPSWRVRDIRHPGDSRGVGDEAEPPVGPSARGAVGISGPRPVQLINVHEALFRLLLTREHLSPTGGSSMCCPQQLAGQSV